MKGCLTGFSGGPHPNTIAPVWRLRVVDAWDYLNEVAFNGEMVRPIIKVWAKLQIVEKGKKTPLLGAYHGDGIIWICYSHPEQWSQLETLYHEMVHQYVWEILGESWVYHGKVFWEVYNEGLLKLQSKHYV